MFEGLFAIGCTRSEAIDYLRRNYAVIRTKEATIGIDSAIDKIVRVVKSKNGKNKYEYFSDIDAFGDYLKSKAGKNYGIEITERFTKLGGNAPIMANALGVLGTKVNCVSPLGFPEIDPVFIELAFSCVLYTVGNPAYTTALEFDDGKIMLGQVEYLDKVDWNTIKQTLGLEKLKAFFTRSNLIALLNWSCMINSNDIFNGIIEEILKGQGEDKSRILFFDLADFSKRENKDIREAVELINNFTQYYRVILGLNENETMLMYKILFDEKAPSDILKTGTRIFEYLKVDNLVIHTLKNSIAWDKSKIVQVPSLYTKQPKLSTGGGDNFNAGLCYGMLAGLELEGSLYTANATSGYYVRNAKSPNADELLETLENWENLVEK